MQNWYKRAIIYQILLQYYRDGNGDGIGDFWGLTQSLDYLVGLGVTCIWLSPFYESPWRDNGYDVSDYYLVDDRFGSQGDFVRFMEAAETRGLRVILDMTFNHTSVDHPWFQAARSDRDSPFRDFYIWSDEAPEEDGAKNVFGLGHVWTWDEEAGQYYYHTFYPHQADLNLANERLRDELRKILRYWLRLGVSGFRLDAVAHMIEPSGSQAFDGDPTEILEDLRQHVTGIRPEAVLLGEADVQPEEYRTFFGDGDRLQLLLNFYLCNVLFLGLATEDARPVRDGFAALTDPPPACTFANFLRNHDELDLEKLSAEERRAVLDAFAPREDMRLFGRGARRRLAPMLGGDGPRLRLALTLLLSLPGVPVLYYGDEIGMGEDLELEGRRSVRTPMQWSDRRNAGFSSAEADALAHPVVSEGPFAYPRVNVIGERRKADSLLSRVTRAVWARRTTPEFGLAEASFIDVGDPRVLAHVAGHGKSSALALHNLSERAVTVDVPQLADEDVDWLEILGDHGYEAPEEGRVQLNGYGYRWFRAEEFPTG